MKKNKSLFNERNYTHEELDCQNCPHFQGNGRPCPLGESCTVRERIDIMRRSYKGEDDADLLQHLSEIFA